MITKSERPYWCCLLWRAHIVFHFGSHFGSTFFKGWTYIITKYSNKIWLPNRNGRIGAAFMADAYSVPFRYTIWINLWKRFNIYRHILCIPNSTNIFILPFSRLPFIATAFSAPSYIFISLFRGCIFTLHTHFTFSFNLWKRLIQILCQINFYVK